jgi:hypothetical protein
METILAFAVSTGGLIVAGVFVMFAVGWFIIASRATKIKETT